ncbi:MAG: hypothetical protein ACO29U_06380 [Crocinitomicaceae bacterium]
MKLTFFLFLFLFVFASCGNSGSSSDDEFFIEGQTEEGFEDGTYCADVTYHNPNTGTEHTYTLEVEVYNNEVTQINWSNGGWLDEDHFSAEQLDSNGSCSFTSDKGYEYTIQITGRNCDFTDESSIENDVQEDEQSLTCPHCGGEKEDYESYCSSCEDEINNTCSQCGGFEYGINGGRCGACLEGDY